jgi:hypothetical protein
VRALVALALAGTLAGCASAGGSSRTAGPGKNPDVLTAEEIATTDARTAYDAVARLRPRFLIVRADNGLAPTPLRVIVNDVPHANTDALKAIRADEVIEIRYLSSSEASLRWGTGYPDGALVVRTLAAGSDR